MVAHEAAESRGAVADFLLGALRSSMGPGSDAEAPQEQQVPEGLQSEVVAEPPEDATSALFSLWDRLKSWGVFMTSQELFAIAHDVTPLELGSAASLADHTNQVFALARCSQTFPVGRHRKQNEWQRPPVSLRACETKHIFGDSWLHCKRKPLLPRRGDSRPFWTRGASQKRCVSHAKEAAMRALALMHVAALPKRCSCGGSCGTACRSPIVTTGWRRCSAVPRRQATMRRPSRQTSSCWGRRCAGKHS